MKVVMKALGAVLGLRSPRGYLLQWNFFLSVIQNMALLLILASLNLSEAAISKDLIVNTNKGKIRGVTLKSATNK